MKSLKHYIISILGANRIFQNKVRFGAYQVTQTENIFSKFRCIIVGKLITFKKHKAIVLHVSLLEYLYKI